MKHVYIKNFISDALVVLISFIILGSLALTINYRRTVSVKVNEMSETLRESVRYISAQNQGRGFVQGDLYLSMWLSFISGVSGFELMVTNADGVIVASSGQQAAKIGRTIQADLIEQDTVRMTTLGNIYQTQRRVIGAPVPAIIGNQPAVIGHIFLSSNPYSFRAEWRTATAMFAVIAVGVMAMTFILTFHFSKKQAEPINEMATAARKFARGDFSVRVKDSKREDEIGELTAAFNAMADSLESSETLRREFVANISHELKTPMTVISGFADGILDGTIPPSEAERYLTVISSETQRLSRLVKSMLDMSKLQSDDTDAILLKSFDVAEVVRVTLLSLEGRIDEKQLSVRAELPLDSVSVRGDMDSITQVIYNLIDNAVKFSPPGGEIAVELWKQGARAYVAIENRGETIAPDELSHIFERFQKTDKSRSQDRSGVGLGLYIVKSILDNHNEDIFVTSRDGVTRFVFTLTIV